MTPIPAQPAFSAQEFAERIAGVQRRLIANDCDAALIARSDNIYYLTGYETENQWNFQLLVVPAAGEPELLILNFELARSENSGTQARVTSYAPEDDPEALSREFLTRLGGSWRSVVIDPGPTEFVQPLRAAVTGLGRFVERPYDFEVERGRRSKSSAELEHIRDAARVTDVGMAAAQATIRPGVVDGVVAGAAVQAMYGAGGQMLNWGPIVAAGYRSGCAHSSFNGQVIAAGDPVYLELTGLRRRYTAPLMRTVVVGEPTPEMRRVERHGRAAIDRVIAMIRPGISAHDVAVAALAELEPVLKDVIYHYVVAYPVGIMFSTSWIENLGLLVMEDAHEPIPSGSVLHLPFSLRRFGEWGVNLSQTIVVTDSGVETLSESDAELITIATEG